jgi:hypothetical protein
MENVQATGEAFSPQKKHLALEFLPFSVFMGHFCPPVSGSNQPKSMQIHEDPDTDSKYFKYLFKNISFWYLSVQH